MLISNDLYIHNYIFPDYHIKFDKYSSLTLLRNYFDYIDNPFLSDLKVSKADYNDYLLLDRYHYFPSSDEETNSMYNACYYKLVYKEDILGVMILRQPYAIDEIEDSILEINSKINVVYRIILHPILRGCGILRFFMNQVFEFHKGKIFYVESALARFLPMFQSIGWNKIHEVNCDHYFNDSIQMCLDKLSRLMYFKYALLCLISDVSPTIELYDIYFSLDSSFSEKDKEFILSCVEDYKMERFFYENK